jgi:K+-transporting ATPase ATPase C chain
MRTLAHQLRPALVALLVFTTLTGIAYPLAMTGIAQVIFSDQANGSLLRNDGGDVVGSRLIGQGFAGPAYFHPRSSAAGDGYDGGSSSGSNLGPTSAALIAQVRERLRAYREENGLAPGARVPVDAVTASGSGLDPHISVANAHLQAPRVAGARGLSLAQVQDLIDANTDVRWLGIVGEPGVNVLKLNLALDRVAPIDAKS